MDMLLQFSLMIYVNSFFWFGHFWPYFDTTKTVTGNVLFLFLIFADYDYFNFTKLSTRKQYYYYYSVIDTIVTGICSTVVGTLIYLDNLKLSKDMSDIYFYILLFLVGYPFMIYSTYIAKVYYLESPEFKEELKCLNSKTETNK